MKKSVLNLLRGGVFALAAVSAFAFTQPLDVTQTYWGEDEEQGVVPVQIGTTDFDCDNTPNTECLFYDEQLMDAVPGHVGKFSLINP